MTTTTPTAPGSPFSFVVTYTCQTVALKTAVPATRLVVVACATGETAQWGAAGKWRPQGLSGDLGGVPATRLVIVACATGTTIL